MYDPYADAFTNGGWQVAIGTIPRSPRTPSVQQLAAGRLAELSNDYITQIQNDWYDTPHFVAVCFVAILLIYPALPIKNYEIA